MAILIALPMDKENPLYRFIEKIPKAELHLHIEGTLEPELMFEIAKRNALQLPYKSIDELKAQYDFNNLQEFLDIYYQGAAVLQTEQDFYDLAMAYLVKAHAQGVHHAEIFFDPQTHTDRGISFETVINGLSKALADGRTRFGLSSSLIMCFLRHLDEEAALKTFKSALPYKDKILAVGLDSSEVGNPPSKFAHVFEKARNAGFKAVAHAGEEGPADFVWEALQILKITRVDHGNHALDDDALVEELVQKQIPMTVCPLSNLKLKVVKNLGEHPLKKMLAKGMLVCMNSDDPAYFGGYVADNFRAVADALDLTKEDIVQLAKNSFQASFQDPDEKQKMLSTIDEYLAGFDSGLNTVP